MSPFLKPVALAALLVCAQMPAQALEFDTGNPDLSLRWDNTLRLNLAQRVEARDAKIGNSAVADEGTYSFDKGDWVAKRVDWLSEFDLVYQKRHGLRVSAAGWWDGAYGDASRGNPNAPLAGIPSYVGNRYSPTIKRLYHGGTGEILDAFAFTRFEIGDIGVNAKLGRHTVYWGESLLLGGHMHSVSYAQSPLDLQKGFATPGTEAKELFRPLNQLSLQAQLSEELSLSAQYLLDWEPARYPEGGTYLGPVDFAFNGPDRQFLSPALGFASRGAAAEPKPRGEWGMALRWSPAWLDGTLGFYARSFADKLPQVFVTQAPPLGAARYNLIYADEVKLFGVSLAKNIAGISLGAELSTRRNTPLSAQTLGVAVGLPAQGETKGPRGDTWHGLVNFMGAINKTALFDAASWMLEFNASHWSKVRSGAALFNAEGYAPCLANGTSRTRHWDRWDGCATKNYLGLGLGFTPTWYQVLPGVDLSAPISYSMGLRGNAALTFGGNQGLGNYTVGLSADVLQRYRFDLKYVDFVGRYRDNGSAVTTQNGFTTFLKDRGFVSLTFKTSF